MIMMFFRFLPLQEVPTDQQNQPTEAEHNALQLWKHPARLHPPHLSPWAENHGKRSLERGKKKKLALRPHRDIREMGWRDGGRRCRYNGGRWVLHTMPCTCGTGHKQRILGHMIGQVLLFGYVWVIFPIVNLFVLMGSFFCNVNK